MVEQIEPSIGAQTGLVENVTGKDVVFGMGIAKTISAQGNSRVSDSLVYRIDSGGKMEVKNVAASVLVSGKDMTVKNVFGPVLVAGGDAYVSQGRLRVAVVANNLNASGSTIGVAIVSHGIIGDNNRILFDQPQAILFGAAFGAVFALISWLLWRER